MSARVTNAVAARLLGQLKRDHRTIALLLVVPAVLVTLLRFVLDETPALFDRVGAPLVGMFPFVTMFLVTSITVLRERTTGTLERLMTLPMAKLDLLAGYALAFGIVAVAQVAVTSAITFGLLGVDVAGSTVLVVLVAMGNAILGMALGLFVSAFASTEFQAVQFMPAVVLPQILLCGLFVPTDRMAPALEALSALLPLTYAFDAIQEVAIAGETLSGILVQLAAMTLAIALALAFGAASLRRRTA
jgi:ABC-2 type transport system permease protein